MIETKNGLFAGLIIVSFLFPKLIYCHEEQNLAELRKTVQTTSLDEIADYFHRTGNWPKIISAEARGKLALEEQQIQKEAYKLAEELFDKIREFENRHPKTDINSLSVTVETYSKIGKTLRNKQGYINLVLTDTVYHLALSRLRLFLAQYPENHQQVYSQWEKLERPFYNISNISFIFEEEIGMRSIKNEIEKFPYSIWRAVDEALPEEFRGKSIEHFSPDDPLKIFSTTYLIENFDPHTLFIRRIGATDTMLEIMLPGAVEFLRRGGSVHDLPKYTGDVRPFFKIMEGHEELRADFSGQVGPLPTHLLFLIDEFRKSLHDRHEILIK